MSSIKEKIETYVKSNNMRMTKERKHLINSVNEMKEFNDEELFYCAEINGISKGSVYFFIELLIEIGVLKVQNRLIFKKEKS